MARRWREGVVIVAAALATIATSKPRWRLEATLPPEDPMRSRVLVVEASESPDVMTQDPPGTWGGERGIRPLGTHTWPGTNRFLISAGRPLQYVSIGGHPGDRPPDAKVTVVSITPVHTWRLEAHGAAQSTVMPPKTQAKIRVPLTHSHPLHVHLEPWQLYTHASVSLVGDEAEVSIINFDDAAFTLAWTLAADTEELCPDVTVACAPPTGATLGVGAPKEPVRAPF